MSSTTVELVTDKAPSVDITVYRKEIYRFLKTVTIKYNPLVNALNDYVIYKGGVVDDSNPETWKYYKNAIGEYHSIDQPMYIYSLDTKEKILYSRDNLLKSPRTLEAYSIGSDYYKELCDVYPEQVDLIKNIRYPVDNWEKLYQADNLTYITGDTSILEENERDSLINQLVSTLNFIRARWDFPSTEIEPLYPWVFWGYIWQILTQALFTQRLENVRTPEAHSWHVWQYITSEGLSDYSDLLTFSQAMFLYRNLDYLTANRGKQSNLIILADNLLKEWSLSLYGRYVIQRTDKGADDCQLYPDLVAKVIPTANASDVPIPLTSVENMIYKLIDVGTEIPANEYDPAENAERQERILSDTTINTYPTKVVELSPVDRNKKFTQQFNGYINDTLIYGISSGGYNPIVEIPSKVTTKVVQVSAKDCLVLFNYCMYKAFDIDITDIPKTYRSSIALKPGPVTLREWYKIDGFDTSIYAHVNVADYTGDFFQMDYNQDTPNAFSTELLKGFDVLMHQVSCQRLNAEATTGRLMRFITRNMLLTGDIDLNLTTATTYAEWMTLNPDITSQIIAPIEANTKTAQTVFSDLATSIVDTLVPTITGFNYYGDYALSSNDYNRIKQLFIQLSSYNITFVDDNTTSPEYYFTPHIALSLHNEQDTGDEIYWRRDFVTEIVDKDTDRLLDVTVDNISVITEDVDDKDLLAKRIVDAKLEFINDTDENELFVKTYQPEVTISEDKSSDENLPLTTSGYRTLITFPDVIEP